jgi:hypothetical protein
VESITRNATAWQYPWEAAGALPPADAASALDASGAKLGLRAAAFRLQNASAAAPVHVTKTLPASTAAAIMAKSLELLEANLTPGYEPGVIARSPE